MAHDLSALSQGFLAHDIDAGAFHHAEHVEVAFELLKTHDFIDAAALYAKGIRAVAQKAGADQKFNLTITYAFMSLIAERLAETPEITLEAFATSNPDLVSKDILANWYTPDRIMSETARNIFLMPAPFQASADAG